MRSFWFPRWIRRVSSGGRATGRTRFMASALTAWVWISLILARLENAESRFAHGRLAALDEFNDGNHELFVAAPLDWTETTFSAPVWNFLKVSGTSDFSQPQYRCSNGALLLRVSLIRYSNLHLEDGVRLLSLPKRRHVSISVYKSWLMIKLPYTSFHPAIQTGDAVGFHSFKLNYYDHLLQRNVTGVAVCEKPVGSTQEQSLLVICETQQVTVKLHRGSTLRRVKELDFLTKGLSVRQQKTPSALLVEISKLQNGEVFEVVYSDPSGNLGSVLELCCEEDSRCPQVLSSQPAELDKQGLGSRQFVWTNVGIWGHGKLCRDEC